MKITTKPGEITLYREPGDKSIGHESTVTHHMRRWDTPNKPKPVTDQRSEIAARRVSTRAQRA